MSKHRFSVLKRALQLPPRACVVLACAASMATAAAPSWAAKPVIDAALVRILAELRDEQREEFGKNTDRWKEVEELLEEYIQFSKAEEKRHGQWQQNQTLLPKAGKDQFVADFKKLSGNVTTVKGRDLSSQALAAGMAEGRKAAAQAGVAPGNLGNLGKLPNLGDLAGFDLGALQNIMALVKDLDNPEKLLKALGLGTQLPKELEQALKGQYTMWDAGKLDELKSQLMTRVGTNKAGQHHADRLVDMMQMSKHQMDEAGRDLSQVQATAKGTGTRLAAIEALMQQASALGGTDANGNPQFDAGKLAELRTYLSSVSAMQNEELVKLHSKEMGDRASARLMQKGAEARWTEDAINRAKGKK
jgi:hypothetical protein